MTMTVDESLDGEMRKLKVGGFLLQKFAQEERLLGQLLRSGIAREEINQLVTKDCGTAGLQNDDGNRCVDFRGEVVQNLEQQALGAIQHAEIVKGAPAAKNGLRDGNAEPGGFQHLHRCLGSVRQEVVVERVRPEHDRCCLTI